MTIRRKDNPQRAAETIRSCAAQGMTLNATSERLGLSRATTAKYAKSIGISFANKRGRKSVDR